ncbi:DUF58 domain-containing protein [Methylobacterium haplocladii]|uniref:DUF58 domain-containing protein n=1 Tax=Methylobacterium haplocladii TaxID=1176176 RepID=A0A512IU26_9HYPH|nr:DUF58 domain-containing protein [Methylobacterium haplocladii]GEP01214.1 hypothetical protein MHA02_36010 [Methylobacterium haplocladii]GJD86313.1 hypothetical protein HPGCJGGD_4218 [Methylobacterium haplocladii]GLS60823.1 hypothetical protein GCM10007887_35110 [Methylobacterium haplocladii]
MSGTGEVVYLPRWRPGGSRVGAHRGRDAGGLGTFRDQVPFLRLPDARRIDIRATLRDPFEGTYVRRFETRTAIEVWALVDLSASMRFRGEADRMALVADLCTGLAASATRIGDSFGLIGCDDAVREDLFLPATRRQGIAVERVHRLATIRCEGTGARGLTDAPRRLAGRPKLVFVVSDFRWPETLIDQVFSGLALHDVVPVLLADAAEDEALPAFGLMEFDDLEGGGRRTVFMRPSLRRRWHARERERLDTLRSIASTYGRPPFRLEARFDAEALSRHLMTT